MIANIYDIAWGRMQKWNTKKYGRMSKSLDNIISTCNHSSMAALIFNYSCITSRAWMGAAECQYAYKAPAIIHCPIRLLHRLDKIIGIV